MADCRRRGGEGGGKNLVDLGHLVELDKDRCVDFLFGIKLFLGCAAITKSTSHGTFTLSVNAHYMHIRNVHCDVFLNCFKKMQL